MSARQNLNELKNLIWNMQNCGLLYSTHVRLVKSASSQRKQHTDYWQAKNPFLACTHSEDAETRELMLSLVDRSPELVATKARIELEKRLKEIAVFHGLAVYRGSSFSNEIVPALRTRGFLNQKEADLIRWFYSLLSRPIHGEDVCAIFAQEVAQRLPELLGGLRNRHALATS